MDAVDRILSGRLLEGDCIDLMKTLPDNSIDSVCCDPPYHLTSIVKRFGAENAAPAKAKETGVYARSSRGFMGQTWDGGDIAFRPELWAEVMRVLKPGGYLLAFSGTRTYHRMAVAIEDAGFDIRDEIGYYRNASDDVRDFIDSLDTEQFTAFFRLFGERGPGMIAWTYGSGFPKSLDFAGMKDESGSRITRPEFEGHAQAEGWGTALKPAQEPICVARKPLVGTVAANVLEWGTGALNIDGCRIELPNGDALHDGVRGDGGAIDTAPNDGAWGFKRVDRAPGLGRWPANIVHDGSEQVLALFPETKSGTLSPDMNIKATTGWSGGSQADRVKNTFVANSGSAARFFYCAKASKKDRRGSTHPTVKPISLIRYLCRLVTPPGGTVLDPFAGSGTLAEAAALEGFDYVLIEREAKYCADIRNRIGEFAAERLFGATTR